MATKGITVCRNIKKYGLDVDCEYCILSVEEV